MWGKKNGIQLPWTGMSNENEHKYDKYGFRSIDVLMFFFQMSHWSSSTYAHFVDVALENLGILV